MKRALFALTILAAVGITAGSVEAHTDTEKMCHEGTTIEVPNDAVPAHLAHGDTDGRCADVTTTTAAPTTTQAPSTTAATTTVPAPSTVPESTEPPASIPECAEGERLDVIGGDLRCVPINPPAPPTTVCYMAIPPFEVQTCELPTTTVVAVDEPPVAPDAPEAAAGAGSETTTTPAAQSLPVTGSGVWVLASLAAILTALGLILRRVRSAL